MLQIGFGLTPFQSGMITFVSALGAIGMKLVTAWLFRKAGFRWVLILGSLVSGATIAVYGFFTPQTPYPLMLAILLVGGFIRSMFFTGVNALAYAEISEADTSKATPITAVFQQVSIALGVAVGGGVLEVSTQLHGGPLTLADFHTAFFLVAAISATASFFFMALAADAGSAVSGHGGRKARAIARRYTPLPELRCRGRSPNRSSADRTRGWAASESSADAPGRLALRSSGLTVRPSPPLDTRTRRSVRWGNW